MKKLVLVSLALVLSFSAIAQTEGIGIGAILGTTVDFTAKFWLSEKSAFVASAGEWVQYSTPAEGGAEYIAVCSPAFTPETVNRD